MNSNWSYSPEILNSGQNWRFYAPCDLEILMDDIGKQKGTSSALHRHFCVIWKPWVNLNWSYSLETLNSGQNHQLFVPCDIEIWWTTLNKANLGDLIAATGLVILLKLDSNRRFFAHVTLKFDGWPRKKIRHVFYTTSFVYHFISINEFKLELQSRNTQSGSN